MTDPIDSEEVRKRHTWSVRGPSITTSDEMTIFCVECKESWPCDAIRLADEVESLSTDVHMFESSEAYRILERKITKLHEALEFYAKRENWSYYPGRGDRFEASIVGMDWGDIARATLKEEG